MPQPDVGCDLSRAIIDTCNLPLGRTDRIANTPDAFGVWPDTLDGDVRVVLEATSGCDGELIAALAARSHPFSRVNPRQEREFARVTGTLAKTDRVDARVLAQMGAALDLPANDAHSRLNDFLRRRRQLVDMRKAESCIATAPDSPTSRRPSRPWPTCSASRSPRKIASLAGLAPHARESGTWRGTRRIWGGRRKVREALYFAALNALSPSSPPCATGCAQWARRQRRSSSSSHASSSSSSTP